MKRKEFINHIRWLAVLLLVPYHAACIFRPKAYGDFYIPAVNGGKLCYEIILILCRPWMMPILFAVSGASAYYALNKRNIGEFAKERVFRLLIPLLLVLIFLSPLQCYIGEIYHYTRAPYEGIWATFREYLRGEGFASGYEGGFSVNGFWFVRYLFYMSMMMLPAMAWFKKRGQPLEEFIGKLPLAAIIGLFILPAEAYLSARSDYSFREYYAYFVFGFVILSNETVQDKLCRRRWILAAITAVMLGLNVYMCVRFKNKGVGYWSLYRMLRWTSILAIFGMFKQYFDRGNKVTAYLTKSSYGFYLLHQTLLLLIVHFIVIGKIGTKGHSIHELYWISVVLTYAATFLGYEILHRIPGVRLMLGTKIEEKPKAPQVPQEQQG